MYKIHLRAQRSYTSQSPDIKCFGTIWPEIENMENHGCLLVSSVGYLDTFMKTFINYVTEFRMNLE